MGCHANSRKAHNEVHELSEVENEQLNEGLADGVGLADGIGLADGVGGFIYRTTVLYNYYARLYCGKERE